MEGVTILIVLALLLPLVWLGYHFGYKVLDAFSPVKSEHGIIVEKEYIPPQLKIISKRVIRSHADHNSTSYDIPDEIQLPEKCILHIELNGKIIVAPVTGKVYDSLNQGDSILVRYSQGRVSQKIYLKEIKPSRSS